MYLSIDADSGLVEEIATEKKQREQSREDAWKLVNQQRREVKSVKADRGNSTRSPSTQQSSTSSAGT